MEMAIQAQPFSSRCPQLFHLQHCHSSSKERCCGVTQALLLPVLLTSPFLSLSCWPEGACGPWHSWGKDGTALPPSPFVSPSELSNLGCTSGCHLLQEPT